MGPILLLVQRLPDPSISKEANYTTLNTTKHNIGGGGLAIPVDGSAGRHAPCEPFDARLFEIGYTFEVSGEHGERVTGRHEEPVLAENHVAVLEANGKQTGIQQSVVLNAGISNE